MEYSTIIAGDKSYTQNEMYILPSKSGIEFLNNKDLLYHIISKLLEPIFEKYDTVNIYTPDQTGCDRYVIDWATQRDLDVYIYRADWDEDGKSAMYKRNEEMCKALWSKEHRGMILLWDGENKLTLDFIVKSHEYAIPVRVFDYKQKRMLTNEELAQIQLTNVNKKLKTKRTGG